MPAAARDGKAGTQGGPRTFRAQERQASQACLCLYGCRARLPAPAPPERPSFIRGRTRGNGCPCLFWYEAFPRRTPVKGDPLHRIFLFYRPAVMQGKRWQAFPLTTAPFAVPRAWGSNLFGQPAGVLQDDPAEFHGAAPLFRDGARPERHAHDIPADGAC